MQASTYLDLAMITDKHRIFNPTTQETFMGGVMEDSSGYKAIKRFTKQQISMDTRNLASYSSLINGPHQLV